MTNFLQKLKKGMSMEEKPNILENEDLEIEEITIEEKKGLKEEVKKEDEKENEEKKQEKKAKKRQRATEKETEKKQPEKREKENQKKLEERENDLTNLNKDLKEEKIKIEKQIIEKKENKKEPEVSFLESLKEKEEKEGELTIDLFETDDDIIVQSAIAGVEPEDLDITIENDILTIRGKREKQVVEKKQNYFREECYWGKFSRKIVLPVETDNSRAKAALKNGILTIKIPKIQKVKLKKLVVE